MKMALVTDELSKRYGNIQALDGLSLEVPTGAVFGLLGPNGAGKSTTFGILCGWLQPSGGQVRVLGRPPQELYKLRGKVSVLPQDAVLPSKLSLRKTLKHMGALMGMGPLQCNREADRVLEAVALQDAANQRGHELSHGMTKRAGLAQALLGEPELLLLDEPTAGLDPQNSRRVKDLIAEQGQKATVLVSSHNLADIQEICTHGAVLDHGKTQAMGTIASLTRSSAEISIEFEPGATLPMTKLESHFGKENLLAVGDTLTLYFAQERRVSAVVQEAMTILIQNETPVVGIQRGTSLETAFLNLTK